MRTLFWAALLIAPLVADTHEVIKATFAGRETVYAQYTQGQKTRSEELDHNGLPKLVSIYKERVVYRLDWQRREYMEYVRDDPHVIQTLALWIARPPRVHDSGKTVHVYYETLDTGQTRQIFGETAKHLVLRERSVAEPGACGRTWQRDTDGWYIQTEKPRTRTQLYALDSSRNGCRDIVVRHGNPPVPGIAVYEKHDQVTREMVEFSQNSLDNSLFEVPPGFKKVDALAGEHTLSWSEKLGMEFSELGRALETWFF